MPATGLRSSISISRSSRVPSRSILRNFCRVSASRGATGSSVEKPINRGFGSSASRMRSSTASAARSRTRPSSASRVIFIEASISSLTMESTSRPTYPTSVNFVASTLTKGARASRASRLAISVLPQPVGPIIRMFLGVISVRSASVTCMRRQRLRNAIDTARLAASWPTMCLSSSATICRGVRLEPSGAVWLFTRAAPRSPDCDWCRCRCRRRCSARARRSLAPADRCSRAGPALRPARKHRPSRWPPSRAPVR